MKVTNVLTVLAVLLLLSGTLYPAGQWFANTTIKTGITAVGFWGSSAAFYRDGNWHLITGSNIGALTAFSWNTTTWSPNATLQVGLGDTGTQSNPTVFQWGSQWHLITGDYDGRYFYGKTWNTTANNWTVNQSLVVGIVSVGSTDYGTIHVFQLGGTQWHALVGMKNGSFDGYTWNSTSLNWTANASINSGLIDKGSYSCGSSFLWNGQYQFVQGDESGNSFGYTWNGAGWTENTSVVYGIPDVGATSSPNAFNKNGSLYAIIGEYDGVWNGFFWDDNPVVVASYPPNNSVFLGTDIINFTCNVTNTTAIANITLNITGTEITELGSTIVAGTWSHLVTGLADGNYTWNCSATDVLGLTGSSETRNITIGSIPVMTNPSITPLPIIIGNQFNASVNCTNASSASLMLNRSGNVTNTALTNVSDIWGVSFVYGALNGSNASYQFTCTNVFGVSTSALYNTTMILPNLTLTIYVPPTALYSELFGVTYNVTSDDGYNFDARWINVNTNLTVYLGSNITYPLIDSFNTSMAGMWIVLAPNTSGDYNINYTLGDVWGNTLTSETQTVTINADDTESALILVMLAIAICGIVTYYATNSSEFLEYQPALIFGVFMSAIIVLVSAYMAAQEAAHVINVDFLMALMTGVGALIPLYLVYLLVRTFTRLGGNNE